MNNLQEIIIYRTLEVNLVHLLELSKPWSTLIISQLFYEDYN